MNKFNNEQPSESRRRFVKIAVTAAYVTPLIASMPAKAYVYGTGSEPVNGNAAAK